MADLSLWLHPDELKQFSGYKYEKRQKEWLAGRICSKQALYTFLKNSRQNITLPEFPQVRVASLESGQPFWEAVGGVFSPLPRLSISHSHAYAAALTATTHCGIDIQFPAENLFRVKDHFCTAEEEQQLKDSLPGVAEILRLALLWTGKEAVKKMLSFQGIPGFRSLILERVSTSDQQNSIFSFSREEKSGILFPVAVTILTNGYTLAISCLESCHPAV